MMRVGAALFNRILPPTDQHRDALPVAPSEAEILSTSSHLTASRIPHLYQGLHQTPNEASGLTSIRTTSPIFMRTLRIGQYPRVRQAELAILSSVFFH